MRIFILTASPFFHPFIFIGTIFSANSTAARRTSFTAIRWILDSDRQYYTDHEASLIDYTIDETPNSIELYDSLTKQIHEKLLIIDAAVFTGGGEAVEIVEVKWRKA